MTSYLLKILTASILLMFSAGLAEADVRFDGFTPRPKVKTQQPSEGKLSGDKGGRHTPTRGQQGHVKQKPLKAAVAAATDKHKQQPIVCMENPANYRNRFRRWALLSQQFAWKQGIKLKAAALRALGKSEKWAKGGF